MFALEHGQHPYLLKIVFVYIFRDIFYMLRTYVCVRLLNVRKTYITTICVVVFWRQHGMFRYDVAMVRDNNDYRTNGNIEIFEKKGRTRKSIEMRKQNDKTNAISIWLYRRHVSSSDREVKRRRFVCRVSKFLHILLISSRQDREKRTQSLIMN